MQTVDFYLQLFKINLIFAEIGAANRLNFLRIRLEALLEGFRLLFEVVDRFSHKIIDFFELTWKAIDKVFLLCSHLVSRQVTHIFNFFGQLCCYITKELVWGVYLILQILFGATDSVEYLGPKLLEIVFETNKIALHRLEFILVSLEI